MMLNLWVVRFENEEVKRMWEKTKEKAEVVAAFVAPAADQAMHATLQVTENTLRRSADGIIIAADYVKGIDEPIAKRVRMYQLAKAMLANQLEKEMLAKQSA